VPKIDPAVARARARLAASVRHHHPDPVRAAAERDLIEARLAATIQRVVDHAPALTAEAAERLAALLRRPTPRELPPLRRGEAGR
jgi:hypothetical protein